MGSFMIYTPHQYYLCEELVEKEIGIACSTYRGENRFWCGKLKESRYLEEVGVHGRITLEWILNKSVWRAWTGLILLRLLRNGRLL
jgi:hypothetical protein